MDILYELIELEKVLTCSRSDDYQRYTKMALHIEPNDPNFLARNENSSEVNIFSIEFTLIIITA